MLLLSFSTFAVSKQIHTGDLIAIMQQRYYYMMVRISNMREEHVFEVFVIVCTFVVLDAGQFLVFIPFGFIYKMNGRNL